MSKIQPFLFSLAFVLGLGPLAGAAPKKSVPALPALDGTITPAAGNAVPLTSISPTESVESYLFGGQALDQAGITLAPWGGGNAEDNTSLYLQNGHSILITTVDEYQGGKITFNTPVSLGDMSQTRYLQLVLHFPKAVVETQRRGGRFGRGGYGRGGRYAPGEDATTDEQENPDAPPVITTLRWALTLADGRQTEVLRPLPEMAVYGQDWVSVAVPLSVLKFPGGGSSPLKSILISADGYATFSVGAIRIVSDTTPLTANIDPVTFARSGSDITLHATADGGASSLIYAWDFDTTGKFVDEAEGQTVATQYFLGDTDTSKEYTVTLTVTDLDGIKKPATTTTTIRVR